MQHRTPPKTTLSADWTNKAKFTTVKNCCMPPTLFNTLKHPTKPQLVYSERPWANATLLNCETGDEKTINLSGDTNLSNHLFELPDGRIIYRFSLNLTFIYNPQTDTSESVDHRIKCEEYANAMVSATRLVSIDKNREWKIHFYDIADLRKPVESMATDFYPYSITMLGSDYLILGGFDGQLQVYKNTAGKFEKTTDDLTAQRKVLAKKQGASKNARQLVHTFRDKLLILDDTVDSNHIRLISLWQLDPQGKLVCIADARHGMESILGLVEFIGEPRFLIYSSHGVLVWDMQLKAVRIENIPQFQFDKLQPIPGGQFAFHHQSLIKTLQFGPLVTKDEKIMREVLQVMFPRDTGYVAPVAEIIAGYASEEDEEIVQGVGLRFHP